MSKKGRAGKGLLLNVTVTAAGAVVDNKRRPLPPIVRKSFVTQGAVVREARHRCCVMLEAQLAGYSNSQAHALAGSIRVS